jgi:hypothetical protein
VLKKPREATLTFNFNAIRRVVTEMYVAMCNILINSVQPVFLLHFEIKIRVLHKMQSDYMANSEIYYFDLGRKV